VDERAEDRAPTPRGRGFCIEGPGFYVWDEDPGEVRRVAAELAQGNLTPRPARRMLVILPPRDER
jgi:hypothetical protein